MSFDSVDAVFHMNYGNHVWCCGTPLASVTFRNSTFGGVCEPTYIYADEKLPFELTLENVEIRAKSGFESLPVIDGARFSKITMRDVRFSGFSAPTVTTSCGGVIDAENTDSFAVIKKTYVKYENSK